MSQTTPIIRPAPEPNLSQSGQDTSAADRAHEAKDQGMKVAATAKDEAMNVVAESRRQAADLLREAGGSLGEQAGAQKTKAAEGLRSLGSELQTMAGGANPGPAADLAHQASEKITAIAGWLDDRDPGTLLDDLRDLARRKPGQFALGALAAGMLVGRATRGLQAAGSGTGSATTTPAKHAARPPRTNDLTSPQAPLQASPTIDPLTSATFPTGAADPLAPTGPGR